MASSRERILLALVPMLCLASACGNRASGVGSVTGSVVSMECNLNEANFDLAPKFFGADPLNDFLSIRIEHDSEPPDMTDGVLIAVQSASEIATSHLGEALPVSVDPSALVRMSLLLGQTCPSDRTMAAVSMSATTGTITFTSIYAPELANSTRLIEGSFSAHFEAPGNPSTHADLTGTFHFLYTPGRPTQVFP